MYILLRPTDKVVTPVTQRRLWALDYIGAMLRLAVEGAWEDIKAMDDVEPVDFAWRRENIKVSVNIALGYMCSVGTITGELKEVLLGFDATRTVVHESRHEDDGIPYLVEVFWSGRMLDKPEVAEVTTMHVASPLPIERGRASARPPREDDTWGYDG